MASTVRKYPDRFVGLGTVPMQDPELAVQELIRCKEELGKVLSYYVCAVCFLFLFSSLKFHIC